MVSLRSAIILYDSNVTYNEWHNKCKISVCVRAPVIFVVGYKLLIFWWKVNNSIWDFLNIPIYLKKVHCNMHFSFVK
jgi:hypothetical protein